MKLFSEYRGLRREIYVLFIGRIMTNLGSMVWPVFTLILRTKLNMDVTEIGFWMMLFSLVGLPINLIGGKIADRFNKRNIIIVCDLFSIFGYIYCALAPLTFSSILVFMISAYCQTIEGPAYDALYADLTTSENRERAYSLGYLGSNLGLVLAPTLAGILIINHLPLSFVINGVSIGLSTLLIFLFVKDIHPEPDSSPSGQYETAIDEKTSTFRYLFSNRVILLYVLASGFIWAIYGMYGYLMPITMDEIHGDVGSVLYGTMSSANCIAVVTCTSLITRFFSKIRDLGKMILGEILILFGFGLFVSFVKVPFLCYVAIIIFTFGEIFTTISSSPFVTRRIPASHRGRILSMSNVFTSLFCSGIQFLVGILYDRQGYRFAWLTILGSGIFVLLLLTVIRSYDRKDYPALYSQATGKSAPDSDIEK